MYPNSTIAITFDQPVKAVDGLAFLITKAEKLQLDTVKESQGGNMTWGQVKDGHEAMPAVAINVTDAQACLELELHNKTDLELDHDVDPNDDDF